MNDHQTLKSQCPPQQIYYEERPFGQTQWSQQKPPNGQQQYLCIRFKEVLLTTTQRSPFNGKIIKYSLIIFALFVSFGVQACALNMSSQDNTPSQLAVNPSVTPITLGKTLYTHFNPFPAGAVEWSPNGQNISSISSNGIVQIWNASTGNYGRTFNLHYFLIFAAAWSPDGTRIATGNLIDHTVQVWDAQTGMQLLTYRGHTDSVMAVAWSPDGKYIASGNNDKTVEVWDAQTGVQLLTYRGHTDPVTAVAWSPDGTRIASASEDKTVQVWDVTTGKNILTYRGHSKSVHSIAWSPNGKYIASGANDVTVQVWDATTGDNILTYRGHSDWINAVVWSPDGKYIASAADDKKVQIWQAD